MNGKLPTEGYRLEKEFDSRGSGTVPPEHYDRSSCCFKKEKRIIVYEIADVVYSYKSRFSVGGCSILICQKGFSSSYFVNYLKHDISLKSLVVFKVWIIQHRYRIENIWKMRTYSLEQSV